MNSILKKVCLCSFIMILINGSIFTYHSTSSENSPSTESEDFLVHGIKLNDRERAWLKAHKKVRIGTSQYPPLTFMNDSGSMVGISADYLKQISERTGLRFEAKYYAWPDLMKQSKSRGVDLFSGLKNPEREKYLNFTIPYLQVSYVVINRLKTPFLSDFSNLNGKKVAVVKNWTVHKLMKQKFPKVKIVPFDSVPEALTAVSTRRAEAYVGDLLTASYQIQKNVLTNLKIAASAPFRNDTVRFAVRKDWPELATILDKTIRSLSREERDSILQKWLQVRFEKGVDWALVWRWTGGVGGFLCLIIIGTIFWNRRLSQEIRRRQKIEAELILAKESAHIANKAKSEFLADMSHEIRTPMNAILGFSEIMKDKIKEPQLYHYIEVIHSSGKALLNLINDILDLSKVEAGKLKLKHTAVSPHRLLNEMQVLFEHKIRDNGLEFIMDISPDLPKALLLDEARLRQVLMNLIGNAIKFTEAGYIKLSVDYRYPDEDHHSNLDFIICVEDSGAGIPEDQCEFIFDAFSQANGQKNIKIDSTGLGLSISKRLIEMMDGQITVSSKIGKGSTFEIIINGVEVSSVDALPTSGEKLLDCNSIKFEKSTILIVDDIEYNRELVIGFLEGYNFTLLEAKNGREAIESAKKHYPDLILMDMKMPEMDGYEAAAILNKDRVLKKIPMIAITASAMKEDEEIIKKICDSYLKKPIFKVDLISEVMRFLPYTLAMREPAALETGQEKDSEKPIIPAPDNEIEVLYGLARSGNMNGILEQARYIEQLDMQYHPFACKLRELAKGYQDEKLLTFVEQYMEEIGTDADE